MDYQDVLAEIGVGSAHPGGFESTVLWSDRISLPRGCKVLEVGCGTGRTAVYLAERFSCQVFGIDIRPLMIKKAQERGRLSGHNVSFRTGSAEKLPFRNQQFDIVLTESVNVFVNPEKALAEYHRVLVDSGKYIDVEMLVLGPVSDTWRASVKRVYGAKHVPDLSGWKALYRNAGFNHVHVVLTKPVQPSESFGSSYPDPMSLANPTAFQRPEVIEVLQANASWLETNHKQLGYGVFACEKFSM